MMVHISFFSIIINLLIFLLPIKLERHYTRYTEVTVTNFLMKLAPTFQKISNV